MTQVKVAVTGATGFVGRHVVEELQRHPVDLVIAIRDSGRYENGPENISVIELDIHDPQPDDYEKLGRPDIVMHLAWSGLPNYKSQHHYETELPCQYAFIKGLLEAGLPSLLVTGTCFEYGNQSGELSEHLQALPDNSYGYAKDALRRQLEFLQQEYDFALSWARLFYLYGEGQAKGSLLSQLTDAIDAGSRSFNMSGGEQLRDYLAVERAASYLVNLALLQADLGVVNVCSGKPISVRRFVEEWLSRREIRMELNLGYYPYLDYEPMAFWGATKKLDGLVKTDG